MTVLQKVLDELPTDFKEIPFWQIAELGYTHGAKYIFTETQGQHLLIEMLTDDSLEQASFALLYSNKKKAGITLPNNFDHYCKVDPNWVR